MINDLSFGIGCFHFGVKSLKSTKFVFQDYVEQVEKYLQSVSNITDIKIHNESEHSDFSVNIAEDVPAIEQGTFPNPLFFDIQFEVYIPFRIQEELKTFSVVPSTERFRVSIFYTYYCPVTFIEPIAPSNRDDGPSTAVPIVREFLKTQNEKINSNYIEFQCLGPSPFHADFYIKAFEGERPKSNRPFWSKQHKSEGYDCVEFFFDPQVLEDEIEARDFIFEEIQNEIGLFYHIIQIENSRRIEWEEVNEKLTNIIRLQRMKGFKGAFKRYFSTPQLNEVFISIAEFEQNDLFLNQAMQNDYKDMYDKDNSDASSLRSYIENRIKARTDYPVRQLVELANFFENRREKQFELFVVLISAILGGIVGSLFTILIT